MNRLNEIGRRFFFSHYSVKNQSSTFEYWKKNHSAHLRHDSLFFCVLFSFFLFYFLSLSRIVAVQQGEIDEKSRIYSGEHDDVVAIRETIPLNLGEGLPHSIFIIFHSISLNTRWIWIHWIQSKRIQRVIKLIKATMQQQRCTIEIVRHIMEDELWKACLSYLTRAREPLSALWSVSARAEWADTSMICFDTLNGIFFLALNTDQSSVFRQIFSSTHVEIIQLSLNGADQRRHRQSNLNEKMCEEKKNNKYCSWV